MARAILIIGEPGTGKSRSIKGLDPRKTVLIRPNNKDLPFRGATKNYKSGLNLHLIQTFKGVGEMLDKVNKMKFVENVVIEDFTHYISKKVMDDSDVTGYGKWTTLAKLVKTNIIDKESSLRPNLNIFLIGHVAANADALGATVITIQTAGKLMDNGIKIPSYFTYVFHTVVTPGNGGMEYKFLTNKDGIREAKTPEEMFPTFIDNDMQLIVDGIKKYQEEEGIKPLGMTLEEKAEFDAKQPNTNPAPATEPTPETVQTEQPEAEAAPATEAETPSN